MQPPPRKAKITTVLRNVHNEQTTKLQTKHQQDADFLEDIRTFTKLKASIDKNYAEALLKLSSTYLQRKIPNYPDIKSQEDENKTVYTVWRTVLDETERVAKARLAAVEVYQQTISEGAKTVRANKLQVAKKCFENLRRMHDEMQQCVLEVEKTRKLYFEEEHMAHEARDKACDAEEKLKKKKGRIFQSVTSLKRNSAKFSSRKEACDIQATKARNDYILAVVAANAHLGRYQEVDLPELMQTLDCDIYERVREYIQLMSRTELLTCAACQSSYTTVEQQAEQITREYTVSCFLQDTPVISQSVQYAFEPCDNDPITKISIEHNADLCLSKEARKWASCIAKETRTLRDANKELHRLHGFLASGQRSCEPGPGDPPGGPIDVESKLDEVKNIIRRAETSKLKAEARIEALREGGVNVEEWLRSLDNDSLTPYDLAPEALSRSGSTASRTSRASRKSARSEVNQQAAAEEPSASETDEAFYDSDFNDESDVSGSPLQTSAAVQDTSSPSRGYEEAQEVDAVAAAAVAWGEMAAEESEPPMEGLDGYGAEDYSANEYTSEYTAEYTVETEVTTIEGGDAVPGVRCVALYTYEATNPDELSFVEQEELEIIGEGDGDGWVRARNYRGDEGYIPQTYVEVIDAQPATSSSSHPPLTSFSSVDYTVGPEDNALDVAAVEGIAEEAENGTALAFATPGAYPEGAVWCRALYDYEATCEDELTFFEGQLIRVVRKVVHDDVDDGWWEGEMDGVTGIFPSLVVEELKSTGEPQTPEEANTPSDSAPPPPFTPPEPQFMVLPSQVILTQPTPELERPGEESTEKKAEPEEGNYVPLVSSPESPNHKAALENVTTEANQEGSGIDLNEQVVEAPQDQTDSVDATSSPPKSAMNEAPNIPEISISEPTEPARHASDTEEEEEEDHEEEDEEDGEEEKAEKRERKKKKKKDAHPEDAVGDKDQESQSAEEQQQDGGEKAGADDEEGLPSEPVPEQTKTAPSDTAPSDAVDRTTTPNQVPTEELFDLK